MSLYFDVVICCDLREDTPQEVIDALRYLSDPTFELTQKLPLIFTWIGHDTGTIEKQNLWDWFGDSRFLVSDPEHEVISSFQRKLGTIIPLGNNREVYNWSLQYCGRYLHDDYTAHCHFPFLYWLVEYTQGLIDYHHETNSGYPLHLVYSVDGKAKEHTVHHP